MTKAKLMLTSMDLRCAIAAMFILVTGLFGCAAHVDESASEDVTVAESRNVETVVLTITPIEETPSVTEEELNDFEKQFQTKLPDDYRRFLLQNRGGFPSLDCVMFEEAGRMTASDLFCFHTIAETPAWASLPWHCETFAGRLPKNTLPIAHDSCGNLWLLVVGADQAGEVLFWDHGTFANVDETDIDAWPKVADSFDEFVGSLREYQPLPGEEKLLSRYTLVRKANEGMASKSPEFKENKPRDFAWHCHYGDNGKVDMQLVQYAPHAGVTHTDGYSQLRAAMGLIKAGPPRLPE